MIFLTVKARDSADMTGVYFLQSLIALRQFRVRDMAIIVINVLQTPQTQKINKPYLKHNNIRITHNMEMYLRHYWRIHFVKYLELFGTKSEIKKLILHYQKCIVRFLIPDYAISLTWRSPVWLLPFSGSHCTLYPSLRLMKTLPRLLASPGYLRYLHHANWTEIIGWY